MTGSECWKIEMVKKSRKNVNIHKNKKKKKKKNIGGLFKRFCNMEIMQISNDNEQNKQIILHVL